MRKGPPPIVFETSVQTDTEIQRRKNMATGSINEAH